MRWPAPDATRSDVDTFVRGRPALTAEPAHEVPPGPNVYHCWTCDARISGVKSGFCSKCEAAWADLETRTR